ncbi:hypothetical protein V6R21_15915 [Limibacter armeniacum]
MANSKTVPRKTVSFSDARNIGVLFQVNHDLEVKVLKKFIQKLQDSGKNVDVLTFFNSGEVNLYNFNFKFFTDSEIKSFGEIDSEDAQRFIDKNYDYLFFASVEGGLAFDYVLAESKASCRVGISREGKEPFFELMVGANQKELDDMLENMLKVVETIRV